MFSRDAGRAVAAALEVEGVASVRAAAEDEAFTDGAPEERKKARGGSRNGIHMHKNGVRDTRACSLRLSYLLALRVDLGITWSLLAWGIIITRALLPAIQAHEDLKPLFHLRFTLSISTCSAGVNISLNNIKTVQKAEASLKKSEAACHIDLYLGS